MAPFVKSAARLAVAAHRAWARKWPFLGVFVVVFTTSIVFLAGLGLTPDPAALAEASPLVTAEPLIAGLSADAGAAAGELPVSIEIPSIKLSVRVENPASADIEALDAALLHGAVRYPTSALLGEQGNVVLFGHSSYLPVVHNPAYKTFDGIQKLSPGDVITVYSSSVAYTYAVRSVAKADAGSAAIPLAVSGKVLTLSTCDSFGEKSDRFIVTADFVESHARSS